MTVKEVAKCLGVHEDYILDLCRKNRISHCKVRRPVLGMERTVKFVTVYEIDPEEIEYLDWWLNGGKNEYLTRIRDIYKLNENLKHNQKRYKMTTIIEEI